MIHIKPNEKLWIVVGPKGDFYHYTASYSRKGSIREYVIDTLYEFTWKRLYKGGFRVIRLWPPEKNK